MRHAAWLLAAALMLVAGCQKSTPAAPDKTGAEKSASTAAVKPAGKACTIAYIRATGTSPYLDAVESGACQKAKDLGVTLKLLTAPSPTAAIDIRDFCQVMVDREIDAVVIACNTGDAASWCEGNQVKSHKPVINLDSNASNSAGIYHTLIGPDQFAGARKAGDYACDLIKKWLGEKGDGKVGHVILLGEGDGDSAIRLSGLQAAAKAAGLEFTTVQSTGQDVMGTLAAARKMMAPGVTLDGILCTSDKLALEAVRGNFGKAGEIVIVGYGNTEPARDAMKRGQIQATIEQNPAMTGAMAVECAVKALQGETIAPETPVPVELVTADQVGSTPAPTAAKTLPKGG